MSQQERSTKQSIGASAPRTDAIQGKHLRKIGNVDEGVVEGSEDASNAENELTLTGLRAQLDVLLDAGGLSLGCHFC